jgi:methylmalonyl-CoA carboxyltransferase large subunit
MQPDIDTLLKEAAELESALAVLKGRIAALAERSGAASASLAQTAAVTPASAAVLDAAQCEISEETLLALSAAIAAFLGKRPRIRQVRLAASPAWVSVGRASIAASHLPSKTQ